MHESSVFHVSWDVHMLYTYVRTYICQSTCYACMPRVYACVSLSVQRACVFVCVCVHVSMYVCLCTYKYRPDFRFRELGCLPSDDSERHSAAMSGGGWAEDKKGGEGGEHREEVSVWRDRLRSLS